MPKVKGILVSRYAQKINDISDSIKIELDDYQSILENQGFKVERFEDMVNFEAAQCLTAEKGNVILRASRLFRGGKKFSISLKQSSRAKRTMNLYTDKIDEAIAAANAAQYFIQ